MVMVYNHFWIYLLYILVLQLVQVNTTKKTPESRNPEILIDSEINFPDNESDFERALDDSIKGDLSEISISNSDFVQLGPSADAEVVNQVRRFDGTQIGQMRKSFLLFGLLFVAVTTSIIFIACYIKESFKKNVQLPVYSSIPADYDDSKRFSLIHRLSLNNDERFVSNRPVVVCPLHAGSKSKFIST